MQLIAHRGASGRAPENTLAAFRAALALGAKALEFDVHQSRDGRLVVLHDDDLRRTAGLDRKVADMSFRELRLREAGSWFGEAFRGEKIPSLEEVFALCSGKVELHVEIKHGSSLYPGIEERLVRFIRARRALETSIVSSFDHRALALARRLEPRLRLGYLLGSTSLAAAYRDMKRLKAETLNLGLRQVRPAIVKECRRRGFRVLVYTVNNRRELARLDKMGVDGVFSNDPELFFP